MSKTFNKESNHSLSAKLFAGIAITALLGFGALGASVNAQAREDDRHDQGYSDNQQSRADRHNREDRGNHLGRDFRRDRWNNGWERRNFHPTPPIVYGTPYYYPPPVIYDPGISLNIPGLTIRVR